MTGPIAGNFASLKYNMTMDGKQITKDRGFTLEQVAALMPNSRTGQPGISRQSLYLGCRREERLEGAAEPEEVGKGIWPLH